MLTTTSETFGSAKASVLRRVTTVSVVDIAAAVTWESAGFVDEPAGIELFRPSCVTQCVELAPAFVEHVPHDDGGVIPSLLDECPHFHFALGDGFG